MSVSDKLTKVIRSLSTSSPDIEAAAVVDNDGLMMASSLPQDVDEDSVAAMSSALQGISERIAEELNRGEFELVMVRGGDGFAILTRCGPEAVLSVLTSSKAKLGLIFLDIKRASKELEQILG